MEAYIDDMLVKSRLREDHLAHMQEAFELMKKHRLRLNLEKCAFKVGSGNFLGFPRSKRGIEMALEEIRLITQMQPPCNDKADTYAKGEMSGTKQVHLSVFGSTTSVLCRAQRSPLNRMGTRMSQGLSCYKGVCRLASILVLTNKW